MALFRSINMSFWTDTKIVDDYTPEDKYFMLYTLTNNYTNLIGCYEISIKQMSNDLGYSKDTVINLLKRFEEIHKTIYYDYETKEILIKNWNKYNWNSSPKLDVPLKENILKVKSNKFYDYLANVYNKRETIESESDTLSIGYRYGIDTTITNTNTITITNTNNINNNIKEIIDYLNMKSCKHFRYTKNNINKIKARLNEGFTEEDCKKVINKKCLEWLNDSNMNKYLRPETLFGNKFESYLEEKEKELTTKDLEQFIDFSDFKD